MKNDDKLRLLFVCRIFFEKTDEDHSLSTTQIIRILQQDYGISAYRMTVAADIDLLIRAGMDIQKTRSRQNLYHLVSRPFDLPEPKLLIDAVISSRFITAAKSDRLISGIMRLAGEGRAEELKRNIYIDENYKTDNEQGYLIVDAINEAINRRKKIAFRMAEYNNRKERVLHNDGERYVFSPYSLVCDGDYYYMVGFSDKYGNIGSHRVDKIRRRPEILAEDAHPMPDDLNLSDYTHSMFRMYNSPREKVELICESGLMDNMIDHFGRNVETFAVDDTHFGVAPTVAVNHIFYSWVFGFGGKVTIRGPENVRRGYRDMIEKAVKLADAEKPQPQ